MATISQVVKCAFAKLWLSSSCSTTYHSMLHLCKTCRSACVSPCLSQSMPFCLLSTGISQMPACMTRLAALLAPVTGAVPRLLSQPFSADTLAVQLHALQLLQLIFELPDTLLLHRSAVAQHYVKYHHDQFVLYYQGSDANPESAAAELAWMQLQVRCSLLVSGSDGC